MKLKRLFFWISWTILVLPMYVIIALWEINEHNKSLLLVLGLVIIYIINFIVIGILKEKDNIKIKYTVIYIINLLFLIKFLGMKEYFAIILITIIFINILTYLY